MARNDYDKMYGWKDKWLNDVCSKIVNNILHPKSLDVKTITPLTKRITLDYPEIINNSEFKNMAEINKKLKPLSIKIEVTNPVAFEDIEHMQTPSLLDWWYDRSTREWDIFAGSISITLGWNNKYIPILQNLHNDSYYSDGGTETILFDVRDKNDPMNM